MQHLSKAWLAALLSVLNVSCAGTAEAQQTAGSISTASDHVADAIRSGNLFRLKTLIANEKITFESSGAINEEIACFLNWSTHCSFAKIPVQDILKEGYFKYYYHIDNDTIVVSYIKNSSRDSFYQDPTLFLEQNYLVDYFSCHFALLDNRWMLTESVCFSETEGPFGQETEG